MQFVYFTTDGWLRSCAFVWRKTGRPGCGGKRESQSTPTIEIQKTGETRKQDTRKQLTQENERTRYTVKSKDEEDEASRTSSGGGTTRCKDKRVVWFYPQHPNINSHEDGNIYHTTTLQRDKCLCAAGWNTNIMCCGKMRVLLSRTMYLMRPCNWENDRDLFGWLSWVTSYTIWILLTPL